jgi:hypothetical protein
MVKVNMMQLESDYCRLTLDFYSEIQLQIICLLHVICFHRIPIEHFMLLQKSVNHLNFYPAQSTGIPPFFPFL